MLFVARIAMATKWKTEEFEPVKTGKINSRICSNDKATEPYK